MNKTFILKKVNPFIDTNRQISKNVFIEIFKEFNREDQIDIIKILKEERITISLKDIKIKANNSMEINSKNINKLTNEQLCIMFQKGENSVLPILLENNKKLIWSRAKKYSKIFKHKLEDEDLVEYGYIGLIKAIHKYDKNKEAKLITYATWWIDQSILRSIVDYGFTVRVPVHIFDGVVKLLRIIGNNPNKTKKELIKIAESNGISELKYNELYSIMNNILSTTSLNVLVGQEEDSELEGFIEDTSSMSVEEEVELTILHETFENLLSTLTERESNILNLRVGLDNGVPRTLEEIGATYNLTRERIRQIEKKALRKLRHPSRSKKIKEFM